MAQRNITIQGSADHTVVISGDGNQVEIGHQGGFAFILLDEAFRQAQQTGTPADFYNGTRANWANIARGHDAPRRLLPLLMNFVQAEPGQRVGVITGLSGEGKTTLLMRLAWEAAAQGMPVLWRHYGYALEPYERPFEHPGPVLICVDDLPYADGLDKPLHDLHLKGIPFVLLGAARTHEWENSALRIEVEKMATVEEFPLSRLEEEEVQAILQRLEGNNALGALAERSPYQRMEYFLDRLQADGQLLPALITARAGRSFEAILESVFDRLQGRYGEDRAALLLRGYVGIALVHRFGFWMTRRLLAAFLHQAEADLKHLLITPLKGELTDIEESEPQRLYTRHPWIAERALQLLAGRRLPEERYLYQDLFAVLGGLLAADPLAEERKLTTKLPLAFKYQGRIEEARRLFERATQANPNDAVSWQAWALLEKEQGRIEEARRLFERASQADPKHAPTLQAWALLEKEQGRIEEARRLFERAVQADPKNAPTLQAWGLLEKEQGRIEEARRLFERAVQADPKNAPTLQAWGLLEKEQGRIEEARRLFERATQANPNDAVSWQAWALLEEEQGRIEEARRLFERASQADPKHAPVWQAWALLEKEQGRIEEARRLFERASQADPKHAPTLQAWALLEKEQGRIEEARRLFERATQANPNDAVSWQAWGLLEKEQGRIEEARRLFERASQADPKNAPTLQAWGLLEKEQGRIEDARRLFERATQANPNDAVSWQAWALLEKEQGRIEDARRLFERASQADPKNAPTLQAWALLEAQNGRPDQAETILRQGLERVREQRGRALLLSTLGGVLARRKEYTQAEDCFREALTLNEKDALTHYHFAVNCLLPQGKRDEACQHLRRALALKPRKARDRQRIEAALRRCCL